MRNVPSIPLRFAMYGTLLILFATFLCSTHIGDLHLQKDEDIYAVVTDEMIETGEWLLPTHSGQPYVNKPPLYFWLAAMGRSVITDVETAQRLPAVFFAIATVLVLFVLGTRLISPEVGLLSASLLLCHEHLIFWSSHGFRRGTMESGITFFVTLGVLLAMYTKNDKHSLANWLGIGIVTGFISMLKPLVGFVFLGLFTIYILLATYPLKKTPQAFFPVWALMMNLLVCVPWHGYILMHYSWHFMTGKFNSQVLNRVVTGIPSHTEGPWFYPVNMSQSSIVFCLFIPAMMIAAIFCLDRRSRQTFLLPLVIVVGWIAILSLSASKRDWYAFPVYPLITLLIVCVLFELIKKLLRNTTLTEGYSLKTFAVVLGLVIVLGLKIAHSGAARATFLAERLEYLPWTMCQHARAVDLPEPRFIFCDSTKRRGGYYRRKMKSARTIHNLRELEEELQSHEPMVVVFHTPGHAAQKHRLDDWINEGRGILLQGNEEINFLYIRGCDEFLPEHMIKSDLHRARSLP